MKPKLQKGAALLVLLVVFIMGSAFILVSKLNKSSTIYRKQAQTSIALAEAKEALIGYALTYAESRPGQPQGYLPCPDTDGDGGANPPCGIAGQSVIGRLPWRTLGLEIPRDSAEECLWYAVSGVYKNNPKSILTSDTDGLFQIVDETGGITNGPAPTARAIAVVFSPGKIVGGQNRAFTSANITTCGSTTAGDAGNQAINYLEVLNDGTNNINNANGTDSGAGAGQPGQLALPTSFPSVFIKAPLTKDNNEDIIFNDELRVITPTDFLPVYTRMDRWVRDRVTTCLAQYQTDNNGKFPWASVLNAGVAPDYTGDFSQRFGRIPDEVSMSIQNANPPQNPDPEMNAAWPNDTDPGIAQAIIDGDLPPGTTIKCFDETNFDTMWYWWWWTQWKQMVFISIDSDYAPCGASTADPTTLQLPGNPTIDAAVIVVAGRRLAGQSRDSPVQQGAINNYLENDNIPIPGVGTGAIPPGDENFVVTAAAPFNDVTVQLTSVGGGTACGGGP